MRLKTPALRLFAGLIVCISPWLYAQPGGIFVCIDANGRRLTSDRLIPQCIDREQQELNPSGTVRRIIPPSLTAEERARADVQKRAEAEARARSAEERRREHALITRYPNEDAHQLARADAVRQLNAVIETARTREQELQKQQTAIQVEMEFYQRDPSKAPEWLKQRQVTNNQQLAAQRNYIEERQREVARIQQRFDEELTILKRLWGPRTTPPATSR